MRNTHSFPCRLFPNVPPVRVIDVILLRSVVGVGLVAGDPGGREATLLAVPVVVVAALLHILPHEALRNHVVLGRVFGKLCIEAGRGRPAPVGIEGAGGESRQARAGELQHRQCSYNHHAVGFDGEIRLSAFDRIRNARPSSPRPRPPCLVESQVYRSFA